MLEASHITITIGTKTLIDDLNLVLNPKDKIAIIGEEGDGKSTLLKCLLGECDYATCRGEIKTKGNRIGYLAQFLSPEEKNLAVREYLFKNEEEYYEKINHFYSLLKQLNLTDDILNQSLTFLSGGECVKIRLLKLLLDEYDILFLDEPTNDLDIPTLIWLENFINQVNLPILYISHDETLLENTANGILHLEQIQRKTKPRHTFIHISYKEYVKNRLNQLNHQEKQAKFEEKEQKKRLEKLDQIMKKVEYQQNTISRSDPHGARLLKKKMHSLKSQEKKFIQLTLTEYPDVEESIQLFFNKVNVPNQKTIIDLKNMELKVKDKVLSSNINLTVTGPEHIAIIGTNGCGKTTLLKEIRKKLNMRSDLSVGYFAQNYDEELEEDKTPVEFLTTTSDKEEQTRIRAYLGNLKITTEEMERPIRLLSGGTKAKIQLLKLLLQQNNVLLLDEVTRNLSPLSNPVIRQSLTKFQGTIISISHDRKFLREVCNRYYVLSQNGLKEINDLEDA